MNMADTLIARLEKAKSGSLELDIEIAAYLSPGHETAYDFAQKAWTSEIPHYTTNLQDALGLYDGVPQMVYADPLKVCIDALRARQEQAAAIEKRGD